MERLGGPRARRPGVAVHAVAGERLAVVVGEPDRHPGVAVHRGAQRGPEHGVARLLDVGRARAGLAVLAGAGEDPADRAVARGALEPRAASAPRRARRGGRLDRGAGDLLTRGARSTRRRLSARRGRPASRSGAEAGDAPVLARALELERAHRVLVAAVRPLTLAVAVVPSTVTASTERSLSSASLSASSSCCAQVEPPAAIWSARLLASTSEQILAPSPVPAAELSVADDVGDVLLRALEVRRRRVRRACSRRRAGRRGRAAGRRADGACAPRG